MIKVRNYTFGAHAGAITSLGLVAGLEGMPGAKIAAIESLLITAIAGNLEVALGIYMYHSSGRAGEGDALASAIGNFCAWLAIALSFAMIILVAQSPRTALTVAAAWGVSLLAVLGYLVAQSRRKNIAAEILKHISVGIVALAIGQAIRKVVPLLLH